MPVLVQGFLAINKIGTMKTDMDVDTTFEGDNTVLMQQVGYTSSLLWFAVHAHVFVMGGVRVGLNTHAGGQTMSVTKVMSKLKVTRHMYCGHRFRSSGHLPHGVEALLNTV